MFIERADIVMSLPKEVLDFRQSYKEVFESLRALMGKGNNPEEFLRRLRILQYFEEGHYERRYHTKRQVAEALGIDEIHLRDAFADFQHHEILVPNSSGSAYRLHNKAVMYLTYLKGFFIEKSALPSPKEQFLRLQKLAKAMGIQDSSRKLLFRVFFDALDSIRELGDKTQTKAVTKEREELMDFFLELQPRVNERLIEGFGHYRAHIFFLNHIALDTAKAILQSGIEAAKQGAPTSMRRDIDPLVVEDYIKRVPSDIILALAQISLDPIGIPSGNEKEAVNAYLRQFQRVPEGIVLEDLPPAKGEKMALQAGIEPPPTTPNVEESAMAFYEGIREHLPTSLLSLVSSPHLEETLLKWYFLALLAKRNVLTFECGSVKEIREPCAFFEDVEVVPLST